MKRNLLYGIICLFAAWGIAYGSDIQQSQQTDIYNYKSTFVLQEDFVSGTTGNGTIGTTGATVSGGTTGFLAPADINRPGVLNRSTGAASGTITFTTLMSSTVGGHNNGIDPALNFSTTLIQRLNNNDANTTFRAGMANSWTGNGPNNEIILEKLGADTNYFCATRVAAGAITRVDSGVAVTTNWSTLKIVKTAAGVQFYLDGVAICGLITSGLPTTYIGPGWQIVNSAAVAKTMDIDYGDLVVTGLTR